MKFPQISWPPGESTVIGIATIVSAIAGAVSKQMTWAQAVVMLIGGITAILVPGNGNAAAAAKKLAADAMVGGALGNAPVLVTDVAALEQAVADAAPPKA